jgi:hypothetical protein
VAKQAVYGPLSAVANLALSIYWVRTLGSAGVVLGTIVSYLVFVVAMQTLEVKRILRGDFLATHQKGDMAHG